MINNKKPGRYYDPPGSGEEGRREGGKDTTVGELALALGLEVVVEMVE